MNPSSTYSPGLISTDQFQAALPNPNAGPTVSPQPQPAQHSGSILGDIVHLLPTAGGILGGIAGGAADALSLGALTPLVNPITGAAAGAGLGKAGENAAEGKNPIEANDLGAAAEGAIGQGVGTLAGKALGAAGGLATSRAGNLGKTADTLATDAGNLKNSQIINAIYGGSKNDVGAASKVAKEAGLDMTNPQSLNTAGSQILSNVGDSLREQIGTAKVPISGALNEDGTKALPSIDDLIHSSLTNTDPLTGEQLGASRSSILGGLGPGQTDQDLLDNGYTRFLGSSSKNGVNTPATSFLKEANQILSPVNHGSTADAQDLLTTQRIVGDRARLAATAASKSSATIQDQAAASTWKDLNSKLQNMIFQHPQVSDNIKNMVGNSDASAFGGNQALTDYVNNRVTGAQGGQDLNGLMHDAYSLRDVGTDGLNTVNNPASSGTLALNRLAAKQDAAPTTSIGKAIAEGNGKVGGTTIALAKHAADSPALLGIMSRIGDLGEKLAPAAGVGVATAGNIGADPVNGTMGGTMNNNSVVGNATGTGLSPLDQLYQTLLANYNAGGNVTPDAGSLGNELTSLAPQVQHNNMVATSLAGMPSIYNNAGGAQGASGILSLISSLFPGTAANKYQSAVAAEAPQLQSLGINPALLPSLMSNGQTANTGQNILSQLQGQLSY